MPSDAASQEKNPAVRHEMWLQQIEDRVQALENKGDSSQKLGSPSSLSRRPTNG